MTKTCSRCGETKPLEEFWRQRARGKERRASACRSCMKVYQDAYRADPANKARKQAYAKEYLAKNRNRLREYHRRYKHGIAAVPDGPCAICRCFGPLYVDHDHGCCPGSKSCRKCQRGLLCNQCNTALGLFQDNPDLLEIAATYLRNPPGVSDVA